MGIPGLARRLEPYAAQYTSKDLEGRAAIIDGPGLAYDAHRVAAAAAARESRIPTYADINAEAIRWLKSLQSIKIKVSAILFDGALPTSKKDERVSRLQQNIKRVTTFRINYHLPACPIPSQLGSAPYSFLAPALMEALRSSEFAQVTRLIPGEADDWCAARANDEPRSIVFTSDTDLILYEYPHGSLVAFFKDVSIMPSLEFKAYSSAAISQRLKLSSLIPLAYAIVQEPWKSLGENVKEAQAYDLESVPYLDFSKRYTTKALMPPHMANHPEVHKALQRLDVRVSEFVHQFLNDPFVPIVFLPFLFEDPYQASAWNLGQDLRILAYSLLSSNRVVVQEYKRKAQSINIQEHTLYSPDKAQSTAIELAENVSAWMQWTSSITLSQKFIWPLFAVSMALVHLQQPPKVSQLVRIVNGDFDNTWSFVHLNAQIHAAMYSLRLLKQCLGVWIDLKQDKPVEKTMMYSSIARLNQTLEALPAIAEQFCLPGQSPIEALGDGEAEMLRQALTDMYVAASVSVPEEHTSKKQRKKERRGREKAAKKSQLQQVSAKKPAFNVFDILDGSKTN